MRRWWPGLLLVAVSVPLWLFYQRVGASPRYVNLPPRGGTTWVAMGDSLTSGVGAGEGEDYPTRLSGLLGIRVNNAGVAGLTAAEGLGRLDGVLALRPRVVLLCLGGNDSLRRRPSSEVFRDLSRIIDRLQARGVFVVLLGVRSASVIDKYKSRFKELAREKRVLLVPNILQGVVGRPALMSDPIHPNGEGYEQIARRIAEALRPVIDDLR